MRVRLPLRPTIFFLAAFAFSLVALIPLSAAVGWFGVEGLAAREATGSIWLGMLKEAQLGPVPLGDVRARLNFWPLLLGRARLSLSRDEPDGRFEGAVSVSRHSFGIEDMTGRFRTGALFAPVPVSMLDLDDVSAHFESGQCESAEGRVRATASGELAGIPLPTDLAGNIRCAEGALLLPLASQTGIGQLDLSIRADGSYRLELIVRQADPALVPRLAAAGFQPSAQGYSRRIEGHF
ncbi:MAG: type II secretion system protein N [Sphingomonadaceae bacterium]|nr:type II secretion system protein N [Sphingomonadaceae bacterium]